MAFLQSIFLEFWHILLDSSFYILVGIVIAGFIKVALNTGTVLKHLGQGRFMSVVKAAFWGGPLPL